MCCRNLNTAKEPICKKRIDPIDNDIVSFQSESFNLSNKFCVLILDLQNQH